PFDAAPRREDTSAAPVQTPGLAEPLARQMALYVPHVLGWDGSVYDADAAAFAQGLYAGLARGQTVAFAAAGARQAVLDARADSAPGQHWHLARVYLGPGGGGVLCDKGKPFRPAQADAEQSFLDPDKQVKVASRAEFVGRRRELQKLRRIFGGQAPCALVFGLGNLGKSSLAARLADRMTGHKLAVVYGQYHGLAVMEKLDRVANLIADELEFEDGEKVRREIASMVKAVTASEDALFNALRRLLSDVFKQHPILLVIDDLEQALEVPAKGQPLVEVRSGNRAALGAVLRAFAAAPTRSRLLFTSRYDFTLPDESGVDLAAPLARVPLVPMRPRERQKQWRAKSRAEARDEKLGKVDKDLVAAALTAAAGNPGLQEVLTRPLLAGEAAAAQEASAAVMRYRATGAHPAEGNAALEFFTRVTFERYQAALSETEKLALAAAAVFEEEVPIPRAALAAAAGALGIAAPEPALDRLLALGLLDDWGEMAAWPGADKHRHHAANPLARPLAPNLPKDLKAGAADAALLELATAWRNEAGDFPRDPSGVAACRLALSAAAPAPEILEAAALATVINLFTYQGLAPQALALAQPALERLIGAGHSPGALLFGHTVNAAAQAGEADLQDRLLARALALEGLEDGDRAQLLSLQAERFTLQGKLEEALKIHEEEELPVFERLGDVRSLIVTKGHIATILERRGQKDDALKIRQEEELPFYERVGDARSLAITKGKIAGILQARGQLDEALRICQEEVLPALESLGEVRELAVATRHIADIEEQLGQPEAAIEKLRRAIALVAPLGAARDKAVFLGRIGDILQASGQLNEALRIRQEEQLPVYERIGDVRARAITMGKIAGILEARGQLDEALRIRQEEQLPVFERLRDVRELDSTKNKIAEIFEAQREFTAALEMHLSRLPNAKATGNLTDLVHIAFSCAGLRLERGDHERGKLQTIVDELGEAFAGATKLGRPDAIGAIGQLYGQVLFMYRRLDKAVKVSAIAAKAFDNIDQPAQAQKCRDFIAQIKGAPE
ncbi:MAG: tetratricopeptide repeat protein, partial [Pseudomonadota bacterium]